MGKQFILKNGLPGIFRKTREYDLSSNADVDREVEKYTDYFLCDDNEEALPEFVKKIYSNKSIDRTFTEEEKSFINNQIDCCTVHKYETEVYDEERYETERTQHSENTNFKKYPLQIASTNGIVALINQGADISLITDNKDKRRIAKAIFQDDDCLTNFMKNENNSKFMIDSGLLKRKDRIRLNLTEEKTIIISKKKTAGIVIGGTMGGILLGAAIGAALGWKAAATISPFLALAGFIPVVGPIIAAGGVVGAMVAGVILGGIIGAIAAGTGTAIARSVKYEISKGTYNTTKPVQDTIENSVVTPVTIGEHNTSEIQGLGY